MADQTSWLTREEEISRLRCPCCQSRLELQDHGHLGCASGHSFEVTSESTPLFAMEMASPAGASQRRHYDRVAPGYLANMGAPQTREYSALLDQALLDVLPRGSLGEVAEVCCGHGEGLTILDERYERGMGIDISPVMLEAARSALPRDRVRLVQADVTMLPIADAQFDIVISLGGVHHVPDRRVFFGEIFRILRAGGIFVFREPVNDFAVWRALRSFVYRVSPALDADTEQPLRRLATVALLEEIGFDVERWDTYGFLGFCIMMNSDVLVFNRALRFLPGIERVARFWARLDERMLRIPSLRHAGLQVVGRARKPAG